MNLKGKNALVTGASTGIGRAIALALAKQGSFVIATARSQNKLNDTKSKIESDGGKCITISADLANIESVNTLIHSVKENVNELHILVNVAGVWHGKDDVYAEKDFDSFDQQVILDTFSVGTIAPSLITHGLIPIMPNKGKIINISGTFENGAKGWLPYYVSKKAIEDLTIGLSEELEQRDIQVNAISPSDTATEQYSKYFPQYMDEAIDPSEIAKQAVFLCSKEADSLTGTVWVMKKGKEPFEGYHS